MKSTGAIKSTSYVYGDAYQNQMIKYYHQAKIQSDDNYEYLRIDKIKQLVAAAVDLKGGVIEETLLVDVGCSIGGCAIECSKMGFRTHGVDFDPAAITLAKQLSAEENANVEFHQMDISEWTGQFPPIDIAVAADIFEHLHDDELGSLLSGLKKNFTSKGILIFYTAPLEYDYIFWQKKGDIGRIDIPWFLLPFKWLSDDAFTRLTRIAGLCFDIYSVATRGLTYKERIKRADHPNPLTRTRLLDMFERQGYEVLTMASETTEIPSQMNLNHKEFFRAHSVTHRALYGLAAPLK
jgi:hypothetical protein